VTNEYRIEPDAAEFIVIDDEGERLACKAMVRVMNWLLDIRTVPARIVGEAESTISAFECLFENQTCA
jgi:hypothetical protein